MTAQRPPFTATDIQALYKKVCLGQYPRIPAEYSNELAIIISSLLRQDPTDRPSASDLLSNPFVEENYIGST
jgi:NIMA (never in mitosis gene a)-related kinase